jgi:hypothetical protein
LPSVIGPVGCLPVEDADGFLPGVPSGCLTITDQHRRGRRVPRRMLAQLGAANADQFRLLKSEEAVPYTQRRLRLGHGRQHSASDGSATSAGVRSATPHSSHVSSCLRM